MIVAFAKYHITDMKIQRTKNAGRNMIFGIIQKSYQIIMPFIMRTVMLYYMGIEYAGLNNLFISILQVLNLAELGIGAAMTNSMYDPIAKDDQIKICALMNLYKKCFHIIGIVVLIIGCILMPFLPKLISGTIPRNLNIYFLYVMYLANTVLSYWLFAYKNSLLYAHQRTDINSKVILFTNTIQYILQLYVLLVLNNYYLYLASSILAQVLTNVITARAVNKLYPQYHPHGEVDEDTLNEIVKKTKGLITTKIGSTILSSVDSIIISAFLGLAVLAVYQNYFFIVTSVIGIISIIYQSCLAGIGNSLIIENKMKNFTDFKVMTFVISWISSCCCCFFLCLFQPFMKIWMGEEFLLDYPIIICIVIYFYIYEIDQLIGTYKDAAGIWYTDRFRPLITSFVNLGLSVITVQFMGLYGVLLSTVISLLFIGIPWMISNLFNYVFKGEKIHNYIFSLIKYGFIAFIVNLIPLYLCLKIQDKGMYTFFVKTLICLFIPNILNLLVYCKSFEFQRVSGIIKKMVRR